MTTPSSADAWERLSRKASLAVSTCDDLLAEIAGWLNAIRPAQRWPTQFPTREAWLRWCEEDRRAEVAEMQECVWTQDFGGVR